MQAGSVVTEAAEAIAEPELQPKHSLNEVSSTGNSGIDDSAVPGELARYLITAVTIPLAILTSRNSSRGAAPVS
jgi:hypothetical protein